MSLTKSEAAELEKARQYLMRGQIAEAAVILKQLYTSRPREPDVVMFWGLVQQKSGNAEEAIVLFREATKLKPFFIAAHGNLGSALKDAGRWEEALVEFDHILKLDPQGAMTHYNRGVVLRGMGRNDDAIAAYRRAVQLAPNIGEYRVNLGNALLDVGASVDAMAAFDQAILLNPAINDARLGKALVLRGTARHAESMSLLRELVKKVPQNPVYQENLIRGLQYHEDGSLVETFEAHRKWRQLLGIPASTNKFPDHDRSTDRTLRIGYVSGDFREHSVRYFAEKLLEHHDQGQVEIFGYSYARKSDAVTERFKKIAAHWRDIATTRDEAVAEMIRKDQIDILIDLAGHATGRLRIFAMKPAPIQVNYLGYIDTSGVPEIDYRLADEWTDPVGMTESLHTEKLVRLPRTFVGYNPPENAPEVSALPMLARGRVNFGVTATTSKLNLALFDTWSAILQQVPNSRLTISGGGLDDKSLQERIAAAFKAKGIDGGRLEFVGWQNMPAYLAMHSRFDLMLDTFPIVGHTTTNHSLWMGVPAVTRGGKKYAQRLGMTTLHQVGLDALIADSEQQYIELAVALANDPSRLASIRATLRHRMINSPLMDYPAFARDVEAAYRSMWKQWCAGGSA